MSRQAIARRGKRLEYFTIAWNSLEGLVAVVAGAFAGSISLWWASELIALSRSHPASCCFGEWQLTLTCRGENEMTLRIVGVCFLALVVYVGYESIYDLVSRKAPEHSVPGILLACVSLIVMPLLSRAKKKVAEELGSAAMHADAKQTDFCVYLSAILLIGLLLNAALGWWWADPTAALIMVPLIAKEGVEAMKGETCCDYHG